MNTFPQLRRDPIVDRWVLIAPERASRPHADTAVELADDSSDCPLCESREHQTPPELFALREGTPANGPGWQVRVVPNRFPAVRIDVESGYGSHELVIDCPQHVASLSQLPVEQFTRMLAVVQSRLRALRDAGFAYAQYFKNHGAAAGASLTHAHGQIVALGEVPPAIAAEAAAATGNCRYCDLIQRELQAGARIVRASDDWLTVTAIAGRFPYETWLLPRKHSRHFEEINAGDKVAAELHWLLRRLESIVTRPAYNLILHTGPWTGGDFHWHFELLPRLTGVAGFEWGTGVFINPMPPEDAAKRLGL